MTGGPGLIFGKSTNSMVCTGSAIRQYQQGARYANSELLRADFNSGRDKLRLMSNRRAAKTYRVWVREIRRTREPQNVPSRRN